MSLKKPHRAIVLQRDRDKAWRLIHAEISRDRISLLKAESISAELSSLRLPGGAQAVLVGDIDKSICRQLDLPGASVENTRRMVGARLETELPYPVEESLWVCERQAPSDTNPDGAVLILAAPRTAIADAERQMHEAGLRCETLMLAEAALAEIAALTAADDETIAVAAVNPSDTLFMITQGGRLCYARRIQSHGSTDLSAGKLANELDQCVHHYLLPEHRTEPARLLLVGEAMHAEGLAATLRERLEMPVEIAAPAQSVFMIAPEIRGEDLFAKYPACVGALAALHRSMCGQSVAAPPLRLATPRLRDRSWARMAAGIAGTVLLAVALLVALFVVRSKQLASAKRIVSQSGSLLADIDQLRSEESILEDEMGMRRPTLDVLLALSDVLPKNIKVESITLDRKGSLRVAGITPSAEDVSQKVFPAMEKCGLFRGMKLPGITKQKDGYSFSFTCEVLAKKGAE